MKYWKLRTTIILCSLVIIAVGFMDFSFTTPNFTTPNFATPSPSTSTRPKVMPSPEKYVPPSYDSRALWLLIERRRSESNLKPYIRDERLCQLARKRLPEVKKEWSHDKFYKHSNDFIHNGLAENLGKEYWPEGELTLAWFTSPEHKKNLDKPYKYSCIETDGLYAVQIFANF